MAAKMKRVAVSISHDLEQGLDDSHGNLTEKRIICNGNELTTVTYEYAPLS